MQARLATGREVSIAAGPGRIAGSRPCADGFPSPLSPVAVMNLTDYPPHG